MAASVIDGKSEAAKLRHTIAGTVADMTSGGFTPSLAVVLVGSDPASEIYVRSKTTLTRSVGMRSDAHLMPDNVSQADLLRLIDDLNQDEDVDGILVQLPLPSHISAEAVINAIDPAKDVDGFHPINVGKLATTGTGIIPCT